MRSSVHRLFQELKSTAVGIQPIKAIINRISVFIKSIFGKRLWLTGPLNKTNINAMKVDNNKIEPITLINESKILYFPIVSIKPQIRNNIRWFQSP